MEDVKKDKYDKICFGIAFAVTIFLIILIYLTGFLKDRAFTLLWTMLFIAFGISKYCFILSKKNRLEILSKKNRLEEKESLHHWQIAVLCSLLLFPPIFDLLIYKPNDLNLFLISFISIAILGLFIKDVPDFCISKIEKRKNTNKSNTKNNK